MFLKLIFLNLNVDYTYIWLVFQISSSQNRVYLNAGTLMLNINDEDYDKGITSLGGRR